MASTVPYLLMELLVSSEWGGEVVCGEGEWFVGRGVVCVVGGAVIGE